MDYHLCRAILSGQDLQEPEPESLASKLLDLFFAINKFFKFRVPLTFCVDLQPPEELRCSMERVMFPLSLLCQCKNGNELALRMTELEDDGNLLREHLSPVQCASRFVRSFRGINFQEMSVEPPFSVLLAQDEDQRVQACRDVLEDLQDYVNLERRQYVPAITQHSILFKLLLHPFLFINRFHCGLAHRFAQHLEGKVDDDADLVRREKYFALPVIASLHEWVEKLDRDKDPFLLERIEFVVKTFPSFCIQFQDGTKLVLPFVSFFLL